MAPNIGWRGNRNPIPVVPLTELSDGTLAPSNSSNAGTATWVHPAWVTTSAAAATTILAADTAHRALIVVNVHASEQANITFDGNDATSSTGIPLAAGHGLSWDAGQVPAGKISAYTTNAGTVAVAYIA